MTNQGSCEVCDAGYYCPFTAGSGLVDQIECPAGYACAETGMTAPAPCLAGEYQDSTAQTACLECPAGSYCDRQALSAVSGPCPGGFYCPAGQVDKHEFMCQQGTYCPEGSDVETSCPVGHYCPTSALDSDPIECEAGYYCDEEESTDGTPYSKRCPRGQYCVAGTSTPADCPIGTYNNKLGAANDSFCIDCPPGKICDTAGLVEPLSDCPATKYCVGNVTYDCETGYF